MKASKKDWIMLWMGTWCIGWSAIFVKLAVVNGIVSAFYRLLLALPVLIIIWIFSKNKNITKDNLVPTVLGGIFFGLDLAFWNVSVTYTNSAIATLLANFAPVWVTVGALLFFKEKISSKFIIGASVAIIGIFIIMDIQNIGNIAINKGFYLALMASVFYAIYLLLTQSARKSIDTISFITIGTATACITVVCVALINHTNLDFKLIDNWWPLVALAYITHVGGWILINAAMGKIKSAIASVSLLSQAIWTAIFSAFLLQEPFKLYQIIGAILVLIGITIVSYKRVSKDI